MTLAQRKTRGSKSLLLNKTRDRGRVAHEDEGASRGALLVEGCVKIEYGFVIRTLTPYHGVRTPCNGLRIPDNGLPTPYDGVRTPYDG